MSFIRYNPGYKLIEQLSADAASHTCWAAPPSAALASPTAPTALPDLPPPSALPVPPVHSCFLHLAPDASSPLQIALQASGSMAAGS
jgi:hypothetical protein